MGDRSAIEWTDATWNPTTGCTKVSPGCAHCYIERTPAFRITGNRFVHGKTDIEIFHDRLAQPLHWRKPRRVFVNSLSDLFHEDISDAFIDRVFAVMARAPQHTFQVLTKRPARLLAWATRRGPVYDDASDFVALAIADGDASEIYPIEFAWPLPNVWLGVSVENQHFADERIPLLLQTPSAVRFISAEPLLGPVTLERSLACDHHGACGNGHDCAASTYGRQLDWVIVGGESGPKSRDCQVEWIRSIQRQCQATGVPCFVKQLGRQPRVADGVYLNLRDKKGGDMAEWPEDLRVREFPRERRRR